MLLIKNQPIRGRKTPLRKRVVSYRNMTLDPGEIIFFIVILYMRRGSSIVIHRKSNFFIFLVFYRYYNSTCHELQSEPHTQRKSN